MAAAGWVRKACAQASGGQPRGMAAGGRSGWMHSIDPPPPPAKTGGAPSPLPDLACASAVAGSASMDALAVGLSNVVLQQPMGPTAAGVAAQPHPYYAQPQYAAWPAGTTVAYSGVSEAGSASLFMNSGCRSLRRSRVWTCREGGGHPGPPGSCDPLPRARWAVGSALPWFPPNQHRCMCRACRWWRGCPASSRARGCRSHARLRTAAPAGSSRQPTGSRRGGGARCPKNSTATCGRLCTSATSTKRCAQLASAAAACAASMSVSGLEGEPPGGGGACSSCSTRKAGRRAHQQSPCRAPALCRAHAAPRLCVEPMPRRACVSSACHALPLCRAHPKSRSRHAQATEDMLATFFADCGTVVDCRICGDAHSAMRFAFIEFIDEASANNVRPPAEFQGACRHAARPWERAMARPAACQGAAAGARGAAARHMPQRHAGLPRPRQRGGVLRGPCCSAAACGTAADDLMVCACRPSRARAACWAPARCGSCAARRPSCPSTRPSCRAAWTRWSAAGAPCTQPTSTIRWTSTTSGLSSSSCAVRSGARRARLGARRAP